MKFLLAGPSHWHTSYPVAKSGTRQSPVDIVPSSCTGDTSLGELKYEYSPAMIKMINTGSSWRMDFSPEGSNLTGGPLEDGYKVLTTFIRTQSANTLKLGNFHKKLRFVTNVKVSRFEKMAK